MEHRFYEIKNLQTRSDSDELYLEGMFVVYGDIYQVWDGVTESIAPGAFRNSIHQDVRALYNHNDDLVLGRISAGTFEIQDTDEGLWGRIKINRNDTEAVNAYERVKRGDISGCSFGFGIKSQEETRTDNGGVHYTITEVDPLYECSICAYPAYEATHISARKKDLDSFNTRRLQLRKEQILKRLTGGTSDGNQSINAEKED